MSICRFLAIPAIGLAIFSSSAAAAVVDLTTGGGPAAAHAVGFKTDALVSSSSTVQIGRVFGRDGAPRLIRTFFTFDLSGIAGNVVAAELRMFNGSVTTPDATETISLYDVSTSAAELLSTTVTPETFADLGTGVQYGSNSEFSNTAATTIRAFTLNATALAAINSNLGSKFSMGASMETLDLSRLVNEVAFTASSDSANATLRLTVVPEPAGALFALPALFGLATVRRRLIA